MTIKSVEYVKKSEHPAYNSKQTGDATSQPQQNFEDEIWALFGALEGEGDEAEQATVREKIWRLAEHT